MTSHFTAALNCFEKTKFPTDLLGQALSKYPEIFTEQTTPPSLLGVQQITFENTAFISEAKAKYKNNYKRIFNPSHVISPFAASQIIDDVNERIWIYIDEYDSIQGPFTTNEMDFWYNNRHFPMDLLIGLADRERCIRLGDFILSTYPFAKNPNIHLKRTVTDLV